MRIWTLLAGNRPDPLIWVRNLFKNFGIGGTPLQEKVILTGSEPPAKVLTKRVDIDRHVQAVRQELKRETDPHCRMLQEDYLRQCGNTVVLNHDDESEATAEVLYHILCRQESNERSFEEWAKQVVAEYLTAGRPVDAIPPHRPVPRTAYLH